MTYNVPASIFIDNDPRKERQYRETIRARYPWVKDTTLDTVFRMARAELLKYNNDRSNGMGDVRSLIAKGRYSDALGLIESRLREYPDSADLWKAKGEVLCLLGKVQEGYEAMNKASKL